MSSCPGVPAWVFLGVIRPDLTVLILNSMIDIRSQQVLSSATNNNTKFDVPMHKNLGILFTEELRRDTVVDPGIGVIIDSI